MTLRTKYTQSPQLEELLAIISKESKRVVPKNKLYSNFQLLEYKPLFNILDNLALDYNQDLFGDENYLFLKGYKELEDLKIQLVDKLSVFIDNVLELKKLKPYLDKIYDYLCEEDRIEKRKYEMGFVFGSSTTIRIEKAIELYKDGRIEKIMISGHKPFYNDSDKSEAESLRDFAIDMGVLKGDIIIETKALTIPDNVKRTLDFFESNNFYPKSIILIASPFVMRRAYTDWLKFIPNNYKPEILRVNSNVSDKFNRNNWYKSKEGLNVILNEYFKNRGEHLIDVYLSNSNQIVDTKDPNEYGLKNNLYFATTNLGKLDEARSILGVDIIPVKLDLNEIQEIDVIYVSKNKVVEAFNKTNQSIIVEDTGLSFDALNGLPGALIKWFLESLGNEGLIKILSTYKNKKAKVTTAVSYYDGKEVITCFGALEGSISDEPRGENGFGWDKIFIPNGYNKTFAEMTHDEKNNISMRSIAFKKLSEKLNLN